LPVSKFIPVCNGPRLPLHSSSDNTAAAELKAWLDEQGFTPPFVDFDKNGDIPAGADLEHIFNDAIISL
jgi:hypothetical protein